MRTTGYLGLALLLLTACADADDAAGTGGAGTGSGVAPVLSTAETDLGEVVVDAEGRTVYVFDSDEAGSGESACSGTCLEQWPPVEAGGPEVAVEGVTGEVGTIERDDGTRQVTLEGLPLYRFAGDGSPGDLTGQAVDDVWWVVGPDGDEITETAETDPSPAPDYSY